jgi:hypothetical protein
VVEVLDVKVLVDGACVEGVLVVDALATVEVRSVLVMVVDEAAVVELLDVKVLVDGACVEVVVVVDALPTVELL